MTHKKNDEELARLFAERDALEEVPDEDMENYEARLFDTIQGGRLPEIPGTPAFEAIATPCPFSNPSHGCPEIDISTDSRAAETRKGEETARVETRLQKDVHPPASNLKESDHSAEISVTAASNDNDQRKYEYVLENADLSAQRKRKRSFSPPRPVSTSRMESASRGVLNSSQDNALHHGHQGPSEPPPTLPGFDNRTSTQSEKQADTAVVNAVATPSTVPLVSAAGNSASKANGTRINPPTRRAVIAKEKARKEAEKLEDLKEKRLTPTEYAKKVRTKFVEYLEKVAKAKDADKKLFLKGKNIFYVDNDHSLSTPKTRNKMDILTKSGAVVVPIYDPNIVTHIITDVGTSLTLKALGLKSLDEIPLHIPTLKWSWVVGGMNKGRPPFEVMHSAFAQRIDACSSKGSKLTSDKGKSKELSTKLADAPTGLEMDDSYIEDFTMNTDRDTDTTRNHQYISGNAKASSSKMQLPAPDSSASLSADATKEPLWEYCEIVRKEGGFKPPWCKSYDMDAEQELGTFINVAPAEKGKGKSLFTCDRMESSTGPCVNQFILDKLEELLEIHKTKLSNEDHWRVFSYEKAIRSIRNYPKRIESYKEALTLPGVGEKTALKIEEIIETGDLERLDYEKTEDVQVLMTFMGVYGVGPRTAFKWYQSGCRTLGDVRMRKGGIVVTPAQEIGIRFYDDINSRMPRAEAAEIFTKIRKIALRLDNKLFIEIMGSYRRGKEDCGDIDILVTRPTDDGKTHAGLIKRLLRELHSHEILTEDLVLPDDPNALEVTYRGLCRKDATSARRRIDILAVPWICRGAALLYYTGDDIFNRAIRFKANRMGYSLNQRGLYTNVIRDTNDRRRKLTPGTIIASETEEDIFRILDVPWQEPHQRVRGLC